MICLHRPWLLHLVIHPDGNIWTVDVVESSQSHSLGMPITMPHEKAAVVATEHCARLRRCAGSASPRQPDRVRRNQLLSPQRSTALREPRRAASRRLSSLHAALWHRHISEGVVMDGVSFRHLGQPRQPSGGRVRQRTASGCRDVT